MSDSPQKVAVVTGAGTGIGRAAAIALLKAREEAPPKGCEFLSDFSTPLPPEDAPPEEAD